MNKSLKKILQYAGIPKPYLKFELKDLPKNKEILKWYKSFNTQEFQPSLLLQCKTINDRIIGKRYATSLVFELAKDEKLKPPVYYLSKDSFIQYWKSFTYGYSKEDESRSKKGELYQRSNLLIFDGIDELYDDDDKKFIKGFVEICLNNNVPFIFISSHILNDKFAKEFNVQSLVTQILEFSHIITLE